MIVTGQNPPIVEVSRDYVHDPNNGDRVVVVWEGTREAIVDAYNSTSNELVKRFDSSSKPIYRLIVESPDASGGTGTDSPPVYFYELISNPIQRSLFEHPRSLGLSKVDMRRVKESLAVNKLPSEFEKKIPGPDGTTVTNPLYHESNFDDDNALTLYNLCLNGRDSFAGVNYAFRITQIVSPFALAVGFSNQFRVYSTAAMIAETGAGTQYSTAAYACANAYPFAVPEGDTLGWLKQGPGFTKMADNRLAIVLEYWLESWADYSYT